MRTGAIVGLALLWTVTAGAQGGGQATGAAKEQRTSSDEAAVKQVADDYVKATLAGDAKAIAALYTEDAVEMPPNVPSVKGRAAIEQYLHEIVFRRHEGGSIHTHPSRVPCRRRHRVQCRKLPAEHESPWSDYRHNRHGEIRRHPEAQPRRVESRLRDLQQRSGARSLIQRVADRCVRRAVVRLLDALGVAGER